MVLTRRETPEGARPGRSVLDVHLDGADRRLYALIAVSERGYAQSVAPQPSGNRHDLHGAHREDLHVGDIVKQTERMWENVGKLLEEGGTTFDDVAQIIVYLRDISDYPMVKAMFDRKFPDTPHVFTLAPVCRPTWLIEMECTAVKERHNPSFRDF